ncbi:hypothetical protein [Campylobacter pinnipediorum]|uniref:hypothetical protein n=1 Tax=Campylobacter pinnipediorum TaxID=1965231 RepID=UPI00084DC85A|nr:hypothetical protein [Campylobacter pinnipediorum]AQW84530.1 putative membrane protein [Campylobacter pinnipediorum subsp. pinnipediorum]OPA78174.1 hypothetical protein BFG05_02905 [Campylobacter pinnipediorum subsp. pinnipediorum]
MKQNLKEKILDKIFIVSKKPILLRDLLEANSLYKDNMLIDDSRLNFRFNYLKTYQVYGILCAVIFLPILLVTHHSLAKLDSHISIIGTAIVTAIIFIGFDVFKIWARKEINIELIKKAWNVHFPYFSYEKYSDKVDFIYQEAIKNNISKKELEEYILERLVNTAEK